MQCEINNFYQTSQNSFPYICAMNTNINGITEEEVIKAEDKYVNLNEREVKKLAESAFKEQPALFTFIAAVVETLEEEEAQEFFIQLAYVTWIAYKDKYSLKKQLSIEEVEQANDEDDKFMESLADNEEALMSEVLRRMMEHPQAALMSYVHLQIGDFFEIDEQEEEDFDEDEYLDSGVISKTLNTFINLLEKARQGLYIV